MSINAVIWFEIYVSDMARAKKFYESVFQRKLEQISDPNDQETEMWAFHASPEGFGAGGTICKMKGREPGQSGTLVYFACDDCSVEEKRVVSAGGQVVQPKMSIGQYGFCCVIKDTEGNSVGLHSMK